LYLVQQGDLENGNLTSHLSPSKTRPRSRQGQVAVQTAVAIRAAGRLRKRCSANGVVTRKKQSVTFLMGGIHAVA